MVAVIKPGRSMHRIFNYNENKVKDGVAVCIGAENFPLNMENMSLKIRLGYLLQRLELRRDIAYKTVHISLNFDPSETHLGKEKLVEIANIYMQKLGFGEQPYLIYRHHDAGHPHIHIVSTNIQSNGNRIDLHHLGIRKSEPARKEIEKVFGLVAADKHARREAFRIKPVDAGKVQYGRTETKRAITNVLDAVLDKYKYTSLPELNAILKQYNVMADRGTESSPVYQHNGLFYRVLDGNGNPIGTPVKASLFYNKPTLSFLEKKFLENEPTRLPYRNRVKNAVDMALHTKKLPVEELVKQLERKGIHVAFRKNDTGLIYGITYVDHQTKCVFNGSDLGKQYSAKAIQERCLQADRTVQYQLSHPAPKQDTGLQPQAALAAETKVYRDDLQPADASKDSGNIIDMFMQPEKVFDYVPGQLKKKSRKKKKRKNISGNQ